MKNKIFEVLPAGRENAVSLETIMAAFGLDNRTARKEIEQERARGAAILSTMSDGGGYFRPATPSEAWRFAASQRSRAYQILKSARAAEQAAQALRKKELGDRGATWEEKAEKAV